MPFDDDSDFFATATEESREAEDAKPTPGQVRQHIAALAGAYGLPASLVHAAAQTGSGFDTGKTQTKPGASRGDFAPDNKAYGVMQVRDDQIGTTVRTPDGSSFQIGEDIKSDWKANAQAGVALLAQHYQLASLENPFGSDQERAQQAYAGYSGGAPYRDRYLQTLPYIDRFAVIPSNDLPAHPDDRAFLRNFLRSQTYGDQQDPRAQTGSRTMEYRFGEDQAPAQTMEIRPGSARFDNANGNNRAYELVQSSQQPAPSFAEGTPAQSSPSPLPGPLQRLKENPGNLFFGDRGASNLAPGAATPRFSDQTPGQGTAPRPSLLNLGRFFSSSQDATAQSPSSGFLARIEQLKQNPNNLLFEPFMRGQYFSQVNLNVIAQNEGGNRLQGYFPGDPQTYPSAGVTIGVGVDLGSKTADSLRDLGVSENLIKKLSPYLGKKGQDAVGSVPQSLTLTPEEARQINRAVMTGNFNDVGKAFNDASPIANFTDLPWQAQTVLADLWYNMGGGQPGGRRGIQNTQFWSQVTSGRWEDALRNLQNFGSPTRRLNDRAQTDATILKQAIDAGTLPQ